MTLQKGGMFAAGCANKPADVVTSNQNATGMALKAIQTLVNESRRLTMDKKYGVYICTGCGIGESLDVDALKDVAGEEGFPTQDPCDVLRQGRRRASQKRHRGKRRQYTRDRRACSRRVNFDVFRFDGCIVDRVNLREQVVWSHPRSEFPKLTAEQEDDGVHFDRVQMLADDYLKMSMARIKKVNLPEPYKVESLSRRDPGDRRRNHRSVAPPWMPPTPDMR